MSKTNPSCHAERREEPLSEGLQDDQQRSFAGLSACPERSRRDDTKGRLGCSITLFDAQTFQRIDITLPTPPLRLAMNPA